MSITYIPTISKNTTYMTTKYVNKKKTVMMVQFSIFIDDCYSTTIFASSE